MFTVALAACVGGAQSVERDAAGSLAVRVFASKAGETDLASALDSLAKADVVFCGETHLDDMTHRTELAIYEGLIRRRQGKVVLALEMFSTDVQGVLDDYIAGRIDEAAFLDRSNPWGNYATGYRALIERARRDRLPVVASNAPQMLMRKISMGGAEAWSKLSERERGLLPPELLPNSAAYWTRVAHATRGHIGGGGTSSPDELLYSGQSLWDNTMGWSCARALERFPGSLVLHVNGGFHTAFGDGTASQLQRRKPEAKVATVQIETCADLGEVAFSPERADADFAVFVPRRARGLDEGFHAVAANREQRYRLYVPEGVSGPRPLLVWLPPAGQRAEDGVAIWRTVLGDAAIVAVLEAPYAQLEVDLSRGGKWYWAETFDADTTALTEALAALRRYVERYFAVDPNHVVLAGEGEGATAVAAAALWSDDVGRTVLAFAPQAYRKLGERGLPEEPATFDSLRVFADDADAGWWRDELAQHAYRHLQAAVEPTGDAAAVVRTALGLETLAAQVSAQTLLAQKAATPRAQAWRDLAGAACRARGQAVRALEVGDDNGVAVPADLAAGARALALQGEWPPALEAALTARGVVFFSPQDVVEAGVPPAPGPFGGTTVVVVPAGASPDLRQAWQAVAAGNPMRRYGRFFRLELAFADGSPGLAEVLTKMIAAHRSNALVVPAAFCADAATMQALQRQTASFAGQVDIAWLPGLGGQLAGTLGK